jgi:hypothetical protein
MVLSWYKRKMDGDIFICIDWFLPVIFPCGQRRKIKIFTEPTYEMQVGGQNARQTDGLKLVTCKLI